MNRQEKRDISPNKGDRSFERKRFTSLRPFKEVVKRQTKQIHRVATLPWPVSPKVYKRKQEIL